MKRFFAQRNEDESKLNVEDEELLHLKNVMRLKENDKIICFLDDGYDYLCEIEQLQTQKAICKILSKQKNTLRHKVTLFLASLKGDKNELVIQKMAELGLYKVCFFESEFSVSKKSEQKIERYNKIAMQASKQCGRADILKIEKAPSFLSVLEKLNDFEKVVFANEREKTFSISALKNFDCQSVAIVVGSEGGFSNSEAEKICSNENTISVSLGKRILRAETATIVCSSIVMFLLGEMEI